MILFAMYDITLITEFQPILENDSSLTSSAYSHSTVSRAFLATEFPDGPLSDSTDSESCSDYTVHSCSDSDDDSDWEDVRCLALPDFNLLIQWPRCWMQPCIVEHYQESTYSTS